MNDVYRNFVDNIAHILTLDMLMLFFPLADLKCITAKSSCSIFTVPHILAYISKYSFLGYTTLSHIMT